MGEVLIEGNDQRSKSAPLAKASSRLDFRRVFIEVSPAACSERGPNRRRLAGRQSTWYPQINVAIPANRSCTDSLRRYFRLFRLVRRGALTGDGARVDANTIIRETI